MTTPDWHWHDDELISYCYCGTASDLSPHEAQIVEQFESAPDLPESMRSQLIGALRDADLQGSAVIGFDTSEIDASYERMADAALELLGSTSAPVVQHRMEPNCPCGPVGPLGEFGAYDHRDGAQ